MVKSVIAVVEVDLNRIVVRSMDRHDQDAKQSRRMMLSASTNTPTNYEQFTTAHLPLNIYIRITEKKPTTPRHSTSYIAASSFVDRNMYSLIVSSDSNSSSGPSTDFDLGFVSLQHTNFEAIPRNETKINIFEA